MQSSATRRMVRLAWSAGFTTIVQPVASTAPSFFTNWVSGLLYGT